LSKIRKLIKKTSFSVFLQLDRLGIHVLPKHYYSPVPDYDWLLKNRRLWARRTNMNDVNWNLEQQVEWLKSTCEPYVAEVQGFTGYKHAIEHSFGPGYGPIESQVLHCFIRTFNPKRIVEVGSGVSTFCMVRALELNASENRSGSEVFCIEPYPSPILKNFSEVSLEKNLVQEVDLAFFDRLESGDMLFIDSSHALKTGSDVPFLYLEVIPRLKPGVFIHIHDIYFPYVYPRDALHHFWSWQETVVLLALLQGNAQLETLCCLSALHYDKREELSRILPDYRPQVDVGEGLGEPEPEGHFPSSIWLRTV
jgi:predicted O-methyltransferase YrrM